MRNTLLFSLVVAVAMSCQINQKKNNGEAVSASTEITEAPMADDFIFSKELKLQGVVFNVSAVKKDGLSTMRVATTGLEIQEFNETFDVTGSQIVNAEVEDLNSDGSPELLVYTQSDGSGSYGEVYAFSVNNLKSMSQVYFPPTAENATINTGYMGHDAFALVETRLMQRFPIYAEGDANANPTGGMRQVTYQLVDGEASRRFEVQKVMDME